MNLLNTKNHYQKFLNNYPMLPFANHSHHPWPDVAEAGVLECFHDASHLHGAKWSKGFEKMQIWKSWISNRIGNDEQGGAQGIAWGESCFELAYRFISSFSFAKGDIILATDSEFMSLERLLKRLEEDGVQVLRFACDQDLGKNFLTQTKQLGSRCKFITCSSVPFLSSNFQYKMNEWLPELLKLEIPVLVDTYHHFMAKELDVSAWGDENLYVLGGGYKYAQMGEGNCWLRVPQNCQLHPRFTGWFADIGHLESGAVGNLFYGNSAEHFAGATFELTSIYRALHVMNFFDVQDISSKKLAQKYSTDTKKIILELKKIIKDNKMEASIVTSEDNDTRAGFVALKAKAASIFYKKLLEKNVETDVRGEILRFGPALFSTDDDIQKLMEAFHSCTLT